MFGVEQIMNGRQEDCWWLLFHHRFPSLEHQLLQMFGEVGVSFLNQTVIVVDIQCITQLCPLALEIFLNKLQTGIAKPRRC